MSDPKGEVSKGRGSLLRSMVMADNETMPPFDAGRQPMVQTTTQAKARHAEQWRRRGVMGTGTGNENGDGGRRADQGRWRGFGCVGVFASRRARSRRRAGRVCARRCDGSFGVEIERSSLQGFG